MYPFTFSGMKAGITRQRVKGGAREDTLYDLTNAYVNSARDIVPRGGTRIAKTLPAGTIGLTVFDGKRHVYASTVIDLGDDEYRLHVLTHPDDPGAELVAIHFAEPLMQALFVVAEFDDGHISYFWLQIAQDWEAETAYALGELVQPTTANGLVYRANRLSPPGDIWQPGIEIDVGDVYEPTVFNGFEYEAIEAIGSPARTGDSEPDWPTKEGSTVIEEADVPIGGPPQQTTPPPTTPPRYGNPGGSGPSHDSTNTQIY